MHNAGAICLKDASLCLGNGQHQHKKDRAGVRSLISPPLSPMGCQEVPSCPPRQPSQLASSSLGPFGETVMQTFPETSRSFPTCCQATIRKATPPSLGWTRAHDLVGGRLSVPVLLLPSALLSPTLLWQQQGCFCRFPQNRSRSKNFLAVFTAAIQMAILHFSHRVVPGAGEVSLSVRRGWHSLFSQKEPTRLGTGWLEDAAELLT